MSSLCPKGPGGALRDSLSAYAKRALSRSVKSKKPAAEGNAHSVQPAAGASPSTKPSTVALQTPDEAQLIAQFQAYRAGKAAAAASSGNATASTSSASASPSAPAPRPQAVSSEGLVEPDEMEEFMSAIGRTTAYIAALASTTVLSCIPSRLSVVASSAPSHASTARPPPLSV